MTPGERQAALEAIADDIRACHACRLADGRTHTVPGEGHPETEIVFIGEGPGYNEDLQGRPFVGAAGNLLEEMLALLGWARDQVFITNVVKCRPPGNRDPEPDEIEACRPFLRRQLEVLDPALVVTLGRFSLQTFRPGARIGAVHGTQAPVTSSSGARAARTYALYHPAAALRQQALRDTLKLDMCGLPEALLGSRQARELERSARRSDTPAVAETDAPAAPKKAAPTPAPEKAAPTAAPDDAGEPGPATAETPSLKLSPPHMPPIVDQPGLFS